MKQHILSIVEIKVITVSSAAEALRLSLEVQLDCEKNDQKSNVTCGYADDRAPEDFGLYQGLMDHFVAELLRTDLELRAMRNNLLRPLAPQIQQMPDHARKDLQATALPCAPPLDTSHQFSSSRFFTV